ncbi:hypothetical protein BSZ07_31455 [Streptomyces sp. M1013]|nr:hypothetical protein BSZ07_31455 [Streptomyces sp. M1013]
MGAERGAYPYANSVLVRGTAKNLVIDSSLSLVGTAPPADLVFVSHAHENHVAGHADSDVPVCIDEKDLAALRSHEVWLTATDCLRTPLSVPTRCRHLSRCGRLHGLPGR